MATDNIAGHTAAQNTLGQDGLRDGDSLSPTTLTNLIQGVQGNGILRYQDGAYGSSRNETNSGNQPGSIVRASSSTLTVSGGFAVLDGALYEFGSGVGNTITLDLNSGSHGSGALTLAANEQAIYTVYVAPSGGNNKVYYEGGSPVDSTTGLYPSASNQYLIDYDTGATQDNMKTIVLAHIRVEYVASGGGSNNLNITEINDKRVFIEGSADYRVPLSVGTITSGEIVDGGAEGINTIAHLNAVHNDNGELAVADTVNVHWVSHPRYGAFNQSPPSASDAGYGQGPSRGLDRGGGHVADSFYFAGRNNQQTGHYSVRLQGMGVDATSTALTTNGTWVVTADGDSFFMLAPNSGVNITLQPEKDGTNYKFPEGHVIEVCNNGLGNIIFDDLSGSNETVGPTHRATFIYEGSVWVRCDYQSAIISGSAIAAIYDNSGTPAFTTGITKAEVQTLLNIEDGADVTDAANVTAAGALMDSELTDLAGVKGVTISTLQVKPSEGAFANGDKTKLDAIEASADVTDATNVNAAGAIMNSDVATKGQIIVGDGSGDPTILSVGTNGHVLTADSAEASGVKWAAASGGSSYTDANAIAAVEAEATLDLAGDVTIANKKLIIDTTTLVVNAPSYTDKVGIGTATPSNPLHVKNTATIGDAAYAARFQAAEGNVGITRYGGIHINNDNTSPTDGAAWDSDRWQISERDTNQFDIAHGAATNTNVAGSATILRILTDGKVGIGLGATDPSQDFHVSGTIRQTTATSAVLVANANGDIVAASNLTDASFVAAGGGGAEPYNAGAGAGNWAAPPPADLETAIQRLAAALAPLVGGAIP